MNPKVARGVPAELRTRQEASRFRGGARGVARSACRYLIGTLIVLAAFVYPAQSAEERFTVATYNLNNYVDPASSSRQPKSEASKAKIREGIRTLRPDVLALVEIGTTNSLLELRDALRSEGWDYSHWEHANGWDTNIFVAVLSRFPIVERRSHTNLSYVRYGRRMHVSRGFAEVDIQVNAKYRFTLIAAHLKSRRSVAVADQEDMRVEEAQLLRQIVDARLARNANVNLVVLGDFNDNPSADSTKIVIGPRGKKALIDTRPAERNDGDLTSSREPGVAWTYYYGAEDSYSRVDHIFVSSGMAREWQRDGTYVLRMPEWRWASDHRPIIASFVAEER